MTNVFEQLGINLPYSAEMYSNSNGNKKKNLNKNTFQQSTGPSDPTYENGGGKPLASSLKPSAPFERIPGKTGEPITESKYGRRLNWQNDKIIEMHLQIAHVRQGTRYSRVKAYISIKTEDDARYMIFMRSSLTTAVDETFRSIKKDGDKVLEAEASEIYSNHYNDGLFLGRVKYKRTKGSKMHDYHRKNLPLSLLSLWAEDADTFHAKFYLLDRDYDFVLSKEEISDKQKHFYSLQGTWTDDEVGLSIQEAFGG